MYERGVTDVYGYCHRRGRSGRGRAAGRRLAKAQGRLRYPVESIAIGASISHSGVCLTVVETAKLGNRTAVSVDAAAETLRLTTAGDWKAGTRLNLERALKVGDELGGHIRGRPCRRRRRIGLHAKTCPTWRGSRLRTSKELMRFVATKGSVALDGISLTVTRSPTRHFRCSLFRTRFR